MSLRRRPTDLVFIKVNTVCLRSLNSFLKSFNAGNPLLHLTVDFIRLEFCDGETKVFFEGTMRQQKLDEYKPYQTSFIAPYSLLDVWILLLKSPRITSQKPKTYIEQLDVTELFFNGYVALKWRNCHDKIDW